MTLPAIVQDASLRGLNTFGLESRAAWFCEVDTVAGLKAVLRDQRLSRLPRLVLGGGSNLVLAGDFDGLVIRIAMRGRELVREDAGARVVQAAAGEPWHDFVAWTLDRQWPGLENLALIPGTVGAAPIQNIGAYGVELAERFESLDALDPATGEVRVLDSPACRFGYRDSAFKRELRDWVVLAVRFRLPQPWRAVTGYVDVSSRLAALGIAQPTARDIFDAVVAIRSAKLPDPAVIGNVGSFFKNPVVDATEHARLKAAEPGLVSHALPDGRYRLAAAWLIDRCGLKGRTEGGASVHERQALVLVNRGGATGDQVMRLAALVRSEVGRRFGLQLEPEPVIIGAFKA